MPAESVQVPVLSLDGFGIAFGDRVILSAVDLELAASGCTVLIGPSGTGKSTLLRTLAGFNDANPGLRTWGRAQFGAAACAGDNRPALVMQNSKLLVSNVLENLVCNLPQRSALTQRMQIELVGRFAAELGWPELADCLFQKVVERAAHEQRMIAILRELITRPALLMVDEPTAGLDAAGAAAVLALLERAAQRCAVLVVLHNLIETRRIARQVVLLANGAVQESQPVADFFDRPRSECARRFLATGSCPEVAHPAHAPVVADGDPSGAAIAGTAAALPGGLASAAAASANCGPRGFLWLLPGRLAGTPWPGVVHDVHYDLAALRAVGVTRLVSLTEVAFDPALAGRYGIACLSSPMPDMQPPTHAQAVALCEAIDGALAAGDVVAVHCRAGLGRTGTVLAAYWLWLARGSRSALQALEDVRRIEPLWVQSATQVAFLEAFALVVADRFACRESRHDPVLPCH